MKNSFFTVFYVTLTACTKNVPAGHELKLWKVCLFVFLLLILFVIYRLPLIMSELKSNIITRKTPFIVVLLKLWKYKKTQNKQKTTFKEEQKNLTETELLIKARYNSDMRIKDNHSFLNFSFKKNFTSWDDKTQFPNVDYLFEQSLKKELIDEKSQYNRITALRRFFPKNSLRKNHSAFNYFESFNKNPEDIACTASEIMKHFLVIEGLRSKSNLYLWKDTKSDSPKIIYKILRISKSPLKDKWNLVTYGYKNFVCKINRLNTQVVIKI